MFLRPALPDWPVPGRGWAAPAGQQTVGEGGGVAGWAANNGQGLELELEPDSKSAAPGTARPRRNLTAPHRKGLSPHTHTQSEDTHTHAHTAGDKEEQ